MDQYRDLKIFSKEYVGEELRKAFVRYTDIKNKYSIQVSDLRHQVHQILKKIQLFEEVNTDPDHGNARLFVILFRHTQIEMISDGNKIIEVKVIGRKLLKMKGLRKIYNSENDIMNESQLQKIFYYPIYPKYFKKN